MFYKYIKFIIKILSVKINYNHNYFPIFPYKINFDVTYRCNSKCRICNIWNLDLKELSQNKSEMSLIDYESIFKKIGKKLFVVSFEGGEPFLREDISDIVISSLENCKNLLSCLIASNGSLPSVIEEKIKYVLNKNFDVPIYLSLSLDGLKELHNSIRGKSDSYDKVMETYKRIKKIKNNNLKFFFQTTICRDNWNNIIELKKNFKEDFIYTFAHENSFFNNLDSSLSVFSINEINDFICVIKKIINTSGNKNISVLLNKLYLLLGINYLKLKILPIKCTASYSTISVDPYGNIKPCAFYGKVLANFNEENFNFEKLCGKNDFLLSKNIIKNEKCPKCWMNCDAIPSIINSFPLKLIPKLIF